MRAARVGVTILIEPLNPFDAPDYFLEDTAQAAEILSDLGRDNLRIMFDCYHVARRGDDVMAELPVFAGASGHIQFAGVPSRGRPDEGTLDYRAVFDLIRDLGWRQPLGAEYRPGGPTEATLGWMKTLAV